MKSGIVKFVVFIVLGSMAACNFSAADDLARSADDLARSADEAARAADEAARAADEAARAADDAARLADEAARASQSFSDDISRIVQGEVTTFTSNPSNVFTPEEQQEVQRAIKSTTCLILEADVEDRTLTEQDVRDFVVKQIIGISLIPYQQEIANKAIKAYNRINLIASERNFQGQIYITSVTMYCGV